MLEIAVDQKRVFAILDRLAHASLSDIDCVQSVRGLQRVLNGQVPSEVLIMPTRHRSYDNLYREIASLKTQLSDVVGQKQIEARAHEKEVKDLRQQIAKLQTQAPRRPPKKNHYTYDDFMQIIVRKFGKHHGVPAALVERNARLRLSDPELPVITVMLIQRWRTEDHFPAFVIEQINAMTPEDLLGRPQRWADDEQSFLVERYNADPTVTNAALAAMCSQQFGRLITECAIKGELNRLRQRGRIERYRPKKAA